ncbi:glycine zipper 2TM domain-containing protein [Pelomonas sp. BJYL3]|uniref:glycine zipper 2TM domain-containing protein n=1 Tax=Pelomonas sp. BJYL3 TaxID=2976697 RepID=UPI0022B4C9D2|nr:glycine zipper 2TM domain-containing protein [Pelomonas sp. BJYL3]
MLSSKARSWSLSLALSAMSVLTLAGCAHERRRDWDDGQVYGDNRGYDAGRYEGRRYDDRRYTPPPSRYGSDRVLYGTVGRIEAYGRGGDRGSSGAGAVAGGVIGGVIGHEMSDRRDRGVGTAIGAVVGAVIGNEIERDGNRGGGSRYRVWVRLERGGEQAFDFERLDGLCSGDRVRIVDGRLQRY